jgi:hypothetical protein
MGRVEPHWWPEEAALGLHEIVIGVIALLALYIAYAVVRLFLLSRAKKKLVRAVSAAATAASKPAVEAEPEPPETMLPFKTKPDPRPEPVAPQRDAAPVPREPFDGIIEVARLRFQIEALEASQAAMREDIDSLRGEIEALRNARNVAPHYSEAVMLAQRGLDSAAIAERCGISVSEAELVAALARGAGHGES